MISKRSPSAVVRNGPGAFGMVRRGSSIDGNGGRLHRYARVAIGPKASGKAIRPEAGAGGNMNPTRLTIDCFPEFCFLKSSGPGCCYRKQGGRPGGGEASARQGPGVARQTGEQGAAVPAADVNTRYPPSRPRSVDYVVAFFTPPSFFSNQCDALIKVPHPRRLPIAQRECSV